jgi:hypothetical protein
VIFITIAYSGKERNKMKNNPGLLAKELDILGDNLKFTAIKIFRYRWNQPEKFITKKKIIIDEVLNHIQDFIENTDLKEELMPKIDII